MQTMKKYRSVELWHHSFLTSALDSYYWPILFLANLFMRKDPQQRQSRVTNSISGLKVSGKRIFARPS